MITLDEIVAAVTQLSPGELARFRRWFAEFDGAFWDSQIADDVRSGKLDTLADQAMEHERSGRCTRL